MAATVAAVANFHPAAYRLTVTDVTMDNAYPTGGLAVTAKQLGLLRAVHATANITTPTSAATTNANACALVQTDGSVKVKVLNAAATPVEVSNGGDLTAMVVRVTAWGH